MEWGFGYGKSEYEVSFGLGPRNGELSPYGFPDVRISRGADSDVRSSGGADFRRSDFPEV